MCLIKHSISPCFGRNLCMTFVGSISLSKAVGTMKFESVGIQYSGSKISSDEPVSVPRSEVESIQQTLEEYLPIGTRSRDSSPCIGDKGGKGTLCVTCHICFSGTGGKDDGEQMHNI